MDLLCALAVRRGRVASKEELIHAVWDQRAVSDDALSVCVHELRKALGDCARSPTYIETIPGRGYRWLAPVEWLDPRAEELGRTGTRPAISSARTPTVLAAIVVLAVLVGIGLGGVSGLFGSPWSRAHRPADDSIETVAVLPFAELSPAAEDRIFADGMTEALINALARHGPLRVISRTSIGRFPPSTGLSAPHIAGLLGADVLVEGSVARDGDRARITVQLIDGRRDAGLWSRSYDAPLGDLFSLQGRVAEEVAREIRLHAGGRSLAGAPFVERPRRRLSTAAVDEYFLGRAALHDGTFGDGGRTALDAARDAFNRAIDLEPTFAEAHVGMAKTELALYQASGGLAAEEAARRTRQAVARALEIDAALAMAHAVQGHFLLIFGRDLDAAERSLLLALSLDPSEIDAYLGYACLLQAQRRFDEAEALLDQARRVDPLSPRPVEMLASLAYSRGRADEALAHADRLDEILPGSARLLRASALHSLGRLDAAYQSYRRHLEAGGSDPELLRSLDVAFDQDGIEGFMRAALPLTPDLMSRAVLSMRLGDREGALDRLSEAAARDDPRTLFAYASPVFVPLHDEPRFRAVLRHYGVLDSAERAEAESFSGSAEILRTF